MPTSDIYRDGSFCCYISFTLNCAANKGHPPLNRKQWSFCFPAAKRPAFSGFVFRKPIALEDGRGGKKNRVTERIPLPDEVLEMVLVRLDSIPDVVSFSLTSSKWYHLIHSASFWQLQRAYCKPVLFRSYHGRLFWRPSSTSTSSWKELKRDMMEMFNLVRVNWDVGVKNSNGMLCIYPSFREFYIIDHADLSLKESLILPRFFPANFKPKKKRNLVFDFDPLSNNYTILVRSIRIRDSFCYYQSTSREWKCGGICRAEGLIRKSFMVLGPCLYYLIRSREQESLELWTSNLSNRLIRHKKRVSFTQVEEGKTSMNEFFTFFLFEKNRKLMLLGTSSAMLRVWSVHEERDEYILKLDSAFQLDGKRKGCKILSTCGLLIMYFSDPSYVLTYCPSTSEWQWIDGVHRFEFGITPNYYVIEMSKVIPIVFGHRMGIANR